MVNRSGSKFILGGKVDPKIRKALQALYGDLRDRKRFTFTQFRKTPAINLNFRNPEFRNLSRRWYYMLNKTLVELGIIRKNKNSIYYVKNFNTLEEWAHAHSQNLVNNVKKIERESVVNSVKREKVKPEKTKHMLKIERKFKKPINFLLAEWYVNKKLSTYQIAKKFGVSNATILDWLRRYNIRTSTASPKVSKPSKKELKELYINQHNSTLQIAEKFGISTSTTYQWLKESGIKIRDRSAAQLQKGSKKPTQKELERLYLERNLRISEIAKKLNYPQPTIHNWLKEYGII